VPLQVTPAILTWHESHQKLPKLSNSGEDVALAAVEMG
jgi:hypothetical protein